MQFAEGGIVSKTLVKRGKLTISLFMMATGQTMSSSRREQAGHYPRVGWGRAKIAIR